MPSLPWHRLQGAYARVPGSECARGGWKGWEKGCLRRAGRIGGGGGVGWDAMGKLERGEDGWRDGVGGGV